MAASGPGRTVALEAHLDAMPPEYLRSSTNQDVLWHLQLIREMDGVSNLGVRSASPVETAVVVGHSRPGFRRRVAEVFAANGIDVLEARMLSRADGVIVDSFQVSDDRTGGTVDREKWDGVRRDLEAGLVGELDTGSKVAARAAAYDESSGDKPVVRGTVDSASGDLVMTIKCADRIGRLAEILAVLNDCGLEIRLAKIDSREGEVIDTFHVGGDTSGAKVGGVETLAHRVASAMRP